MKYLLLRLIVSIIRLLPGGWSRTIGGMIILKALCLIANSLKRELPQ
jgi:hypothetical protein